MSLDNARLVLVEWLDSFGCSTTWGALPPTPHTMPICRSVGWLFENEDSFTVVPHVHDADDNIGAEESGCGEMTIPKTAVKRITDLRKK